MEFTTGRTAILLDEHPLWLDAVESVLGGAGVTVVGKVTRAEDALASIASLEPSLFVAEIDLPHSELDGLDVVARVRRDFPHVKTIVLSQADDADLISKVLAIGATAFVVKTAHPDDLGAAVRQAFQKSVYFAGAPVAAAAAASMDDVPLTRREAEILSLVADGRTNAQLARTLWVTEQTVKFHLSNIYRKLNVGNRTEASRWAQRHGLVVDPGDRDAGVDDPARKNGLSLVSNA